MMSGALACSAGAPSSPVALFISLVSLLVHVPFSNPPVVLDYELKDLLEEYDYVIVGGGSAGCVIANRLSADPNTSVLLLEAGGLEDASRQIPGMAPFNLGGHDDWAYVTVPQRNACLSCREQRVGLPRGRVLGGSSVLNYMVYTRGSRHDYDRWSEEYGATGWSYENVLPHFKEIEDYRVGPPGEYHGTSGEINVDYPSTRTTLSDIFLVACNESGYPNVDYNGPTLLGCSRPQTNTKDGARVSASTAFIQPIIGRRKNLHVALLSQVTKVNFEGRRAVGVTFTRLGHVVNVSARREVILSAGAYGSAQMLMLSGVGPNEHLERLQIPVIADLPVGQNLQDHAVLFPGFPIGTSTAVQLKPFSLDDVVQYAKNRSGQLSVPAGNEALLFLSTDYAPRPDLPDIEVILMSILPASQVARSMWQGMGFRAETYDSYLGAHNDMPGFQAVVVHNRPKSRGTIKLRSANPTDYPDIDPQYLQHPEDVKAAAQGLKIFLEKILGTSTMQSIDATPWNVTFPDCANSGPLWSLEYFECLFRHTAQTTHHACCTAPMGSHSGAVVDERLRVRGGVTGLRVADASIMPDIITGHTNAPCMMIGSKAAALILEDNRRY
ncbi:4-pyridoxate dehydrogenase-like [Haemaphysalis longicornis]